MAFSPYIAVNHLLATWGKRPQYIVGLDSATRNLESIAHFLKGEESSVGGPIPQLTAQLAAIRDALPDRLNQALTTVSGWFDASAPRRLEQVRQDTLARWVVNQYPKRRYPAVMIGTSNGAGVHLCTALGIPWLPQTLLICTRYTGDKDDPTQVMNWARARVQRLLQKNSELSVYQMHDPNQDRLKVGRVAYFRLKRTRLGAQYQRFLQRNLMPGSTIFLLECRYHWTATRLCDRYTFQVGGKGGVPPEEYLQGSPRITNFLQKQGSSHHQWRSPPANGQWPESEWGFDPALREDIIAFARKHGLKVCRIVFDDPQALSPLVADLYRWWYQQQGWSSHRLLVESFTYLHPWWSLRKGMVPYWTVFNDQTSLGLLRQYLETTAPYDDIYLTLFANGVNSVGIASIDQWHDEVLSQAQHRGQFLGVNERNYPRDNASFIRHYLQLKHMPGNLPMPQPLSLKQLDEFLHREKERQQANLGDGRYAVEWLRESTSSQR